MSRPFFFGGSQSSQQSQYLVQMKAGKMVRNGNLVSPIKDKKGLVYLHQSSDDNLMHFCWKDRTTGQLEDDLIIFPDDAEFLKVPQCTTGRVFVLKFKTSPRRLFFWSQEAKDDRDEEIVSKINEYINNPMAAAANSRNSGSSSGGSSGGNSANDLATEEEFRQLFSNPNSSISAQQLMSMLDSGLALLPPGAGRLASLLGSAGNSSSPSSTSSTRNSSASSPASGTPAQGKTPATPFSLLHLADSNESDSAGSGSGSGSGGQVKLSDLKTILSNAEAAAAAAASSNEDSNVKVDLSTSINVDVLRPLLSNEKFMKQVMEMLPELPEAEANKTSEQFISTIQSPQFQQSLQSFSMALMSGQCGPLIRQFGLPEMCALAADEGNLHRFCMELQKSLHKGGVEQCDKPEEEDSKKERDETKKKPNADEEGEEDADADDQMALD